MIFINKFKNIYLLCLILYYNYITLYKGNKNFKKFPIFFVKINFQSWLSVKMFYKYY